MVSVGDGYLFPVSAVIAVHQDGEAYVHGVMAQRMHVIISRSAFFMSVVAWFASPTNARNNGSLQSCCISKTTLLLLAISSTLINQF